MDAAGGIWAFYYIQGEDGEERSHPNAFRIPVSNGADVTLADLHRHFPLKDPSAFHFRFRINGKSGGTSTFFWLDVTSPGQKVPLINGRVICKLLRFVRPTKVGLIFKRKPVLQWANEGNKSSQGSGALDGVKSSVQPLSRGGGRNGTNDAPFHRSSSSPAFDKGRPTKYSDSIGGDPGAEHSRTPSSSGPPSRTGSGAGLKVDQMPPQDFLSGGSSTASVKKDVNLMSDSGWSDGPSTLQKNASANSFLSSMDPLAPSNSTAANKRAPPVRTSTEQPKFEDDGGQTVGPVTMAEMKKYSTSTSDGSNVYNPDLVDKSTKSEAVRRAMEERERQKHMDVEKAREELRQREEAVKNMNVMKENANTVLGPKLKSWAEDNGRVKNIRTLLSTMHQVMWEDSKWTEVNMGKLINPADVKKHYRKAMIVVHPDKSGGRSAEQLLIAERVFAAVNTAWEEFLKTNPC